MAAQNAFLLNCNRAVNRTENCFCRDACRQHCIDRMVAVRSESDLHQEHTSIENFQDNHLTDMWNLTLQEIITGYSLYRKCTLTTGMTSFGPSLNHVPAFMHMPHQDKKKLSRRISLIKGVYENWDEIVTNVTHHSMKYVDVRKFSVNQLSECIKFDWVKDYNTKHAPKPKRRKKTIPNKEYPRRIIDELLRHIERSRILDIVNHDPDQVKLIANDLLDGMIEKGNN